MKIESDLSKYYDPETEFNESTFDGDEFEEAVKDVFNQEGIPVDDCYPLTVGYMENPKESMFATISAWLWTFHNEDIPLSQFEDYKGSILKDLKKYFPSLDEEGTSISLYHTDWSLDEYRVRMRLVVEYKLKESK